MTTLTSDQLNQIAAAIGYTGDAQQIAKIEIEDARRGGYIITVTTTSGGEVVIRHTNSDSYNYDNAAFEKLAKELGIESTFSNVKVSKWSSKDVSTYYIEFDKLPRNRAGAPKLSEAQVSLLELIYQSILEQRYKGDEQANVGRVNYQQNQAHATIIKLVSYGLISVVSSGSHVDRTYLLSELGFAVCVELGMKSQESYNVLRDQQNKVSMAIRADEDANSVVLGYCIPTEFSGVFGVKPSRELSYSRIVIILKPVGYSQKLDATISYDRNSKSWVMEYSEFKNVPLDMLQGILVGIHLIIENLNKQVVIE